MNDEDGFATSFIYRYQARPPFLSNMCLATFVVNYDPVSASTVTGLENDNPDNDDDNKAGVNHDGVNGANENVSPDGDTGNDDDN